MKNVGKGKHKKRGGLKNTEDVEDEKKKKVEAENLDNLENGNFDSKEVNSENLYNGNLK